MAAHRRQPVDDGTAAAKPCRARYVSYRCRAADLQYGYLAFSVGFTSSPYPQLRNAVGNW